MPSRPSFSRTRHSARRRATAFTLVEMLTVMVIIIILMSITVAIGAGVQRQRAIQKAKGEMTALGAALEQFKATYHEYPPADDGSGASPQQIMTRALFGRGRWIPASQTPTGTKVPAKFESISMDQDVPKWGQPLLDETKVTLGADPNATGSTEPVPLDPWGNAYIYRYKKVKDVIESNPAKRDWKSIKFVLVSRGPDGVPTTEEQNFIWATGGGAKQEGNLSSDYLSQRDLGDNLVFPSQ